MADEKVKYGDYANSICANKLSQRKDLITALQILPDDKQKWVIQNVFYFSTYGKRYGSRMSRGLCQAKEIVFISEKAFPKTFELESLDTRFFVWLVLHETAHAIHKHKCRIYDGISDTEYDAQEREATADAIGWFNDYALKNKITPIEEKNVRDYTETLDSMVDDWEWTWDKVVGKRKEIEMNGTEVIPYDFEDQQYEIRVVSDGATIYVRAFLDGKPANGYDYRVNIMTKFDLKRAMGVDAVMDLVESAKEDIKLKRWEHLLKAMKEVEEAS
jgi:hypothetical protein